MMRKIDASRGLLLLQKLEPWEWPEDAGDVLLAVLADPEAAVEDRRVAADLAGNAVVVDDEIVAALLRIVSDAGEREEVRIAAAISFGPVLELGYIEGFEESDPFADVPISETTYDEIRRRLRTLFHDPAVPGEVRRRILEGSVRAPDDWHEGAIRAAYRSGDPLWKLSAVFAAQYVPGFDAEILEALSDPDPDVRYEAVRAAGSSGVIDAWPHLVGIIRAGEADRDLLLAAIAGLPNIRPTEAAEVLAELDTDDEQIQEAIREALAMAITDWPQDDTEDEDGDLF